MITSVDFSTKPYSTQQISEIVDSCPKSWVVVEITQRDHFGLPLSGRLLGQSQTEDQALEIVKKIESNDLYCFYTDIIDDEVGSDY